MIMTGITFLFHLLTSYVTQPKHIRRRSEIWKLFELISLYRVENNVYVLHFTAPSLVNEDCVSIPIQIGGLEPFN